MPMLKTHVFQGNVRPNADQMPTMAWFGDVSCAGGLESAGEGEPWGGSGVPQRHA